MFLIIDILWAVEIRHLNRIAYYYERKFLIPAWHHWPYGLQEPKKIFFCKVDDWNLILEVKVCRR